MSHQSPRGAGRRWLAGWLWLWCLLLPGPHLAAGQAPAGSRGSDRGPPPLFASHEMLSLTLEADFHTLRREDREDGAPERPARMVVHGAGAPLVIDLEIRTRGNFRLSPLNCSLPPLRLDFPRGDGAGTVFESQDKLKLVVPCRPGSERYEQYLLSEYLAYRIHDHLTDRSFRVRLAEITFSDTSGRDDPFTAPAFFIESEEALAERLNGIALDLESHIRVDPFLLDADEALLGSLFQYLIGNTDWSIVVRHNEVIVRDARARHFAIPYDFDFSGLVDARYAVPDSTLPITTVRARLYRGFCWEVDNVEAVLARFHGARDAILSTIATIPGFSDRRRVDTVDYIEDFYAEIADPARARRWIEESCRR